MFTNTPSSSNPGFTLSPNAFTAQTQQQTQNQTVNPYAGLFTSTSTILQNTNQTPDPHQFNTLNPYQDSNSDDDQARYTTQQLKPIAAAFMNTSETQPKDFLRKWRVERGLPVTPLEQSGLPITPGGFIGSGEGFSRNEKNENRQDEEISVNGRSTLAFGQGDQGGQNAQIGLGVHMPPAGVEGMSRGRSGSGSGRGRSVGEDGEIMDGSA